MAIAAIPTTYNGQTFRSRLEAKWAFYFDWHKAEWQYEPKMMDLGRGVRYLPDFFFPRSGLWVEIKRFGDDEIDKPRLFALLGGKIIVLRGHPLEYEVCAPWSMVRKGSIPRLVPIPDARIIECDTCDNLIIGTETEDTLLDLGVFMPRKGKRLHSHACGTPSVVKAARIGSLVASCLASRLHFWNEA